MIELTVHGDPAACRSAAEEAKRAVKTAEEQSGTLRRATCDSWRGAAAEGYRSRVRDAARGLDDVASRITPACRALEDLAGELEVVQSRMEGVRSKAAGAGLRVSGDTVHPPSGGGEMMPPEQLEAHNAKVTAYEEALAAAEDARTKEREAHERVVSAMKASNGDGLVENLLEKLGIAPPDNAGLASGAAFTLGLGALGVGGLSTWMSHGALGTWQPMFRTANNRWQWGTNKGWSAGQRFRLAMRRGAMERDFKAKTGQSVNRGRWVKAGKWATRAGSAVSGLTEGWSQWQADADDPSLDTGERIDRAGTSAVTTGVGALAGAKGGTVLGGAIGTAICPGVGTAVGGVIGGAVGGAIGAYAGSELADAVNEQWDGAVHAVSDGLDAAGDAASDAADKVGDVASDVGDAVTFWD